MLGTPTSSSASSPFGDDSTETPRNPLPQNAGQFLALAGFKRIAPDQDTCAVPRFGTADAKYISTHLEQ